MDAIAPSLRWFHGGYELRDPARSDADGSTIVKLWLGADDRAAATRAMAALELGSTRSPGGPRRSAQCHPVTSVAPSPGGAVPVELTALATRPWGIVEGCLVQVIEDVDVIVSEWLEITGGNAMQAERAINRIHLWDLLDEEDGGDARADLAAATNLAHMWLPRLAQAAAIERVVVELRVSHVGPELTVFRWDTPGAAPSSTTSARGPRMHGE